MAKTTTVSAITSINFEDNWIFDLGYGHYLMGDTSKFSSSESYGGDDAIITTDNTIHPVEKRDSVNFIPKVLSSMIIVVTRWNMCRS